MRAPISFKKIAGFALLTAAATLSATDGYFDHGYGVKAKGLGGAGVAFAQDALAPATNPAGIVQVADSVELGLTYFRPDRGATQGGVYADANGKAGFFIPDFAYKQAISADLAFDLSIFGNGGMNTTYANANPLFGSTPLTMNLEQAFVAPTLAYKLDARNTIGISAILQYQRFRATGLQNFGIIDPGTDSTFGGGARLGYTGVLNDWLTVGATYQTRIYSGKFKKYSGLFAEQGGFDTPSNYALGFAIKASPTVTWAFDVERIRYSEINSVGNLLNAGTFGAGLGAANGPGFGWQDVTAIKTGIAYEYSPELTLRLGYNHCSQPILSTQTTFNIIAPGVVQDHLTLGATWKYSRNLEFSAFYAHAFEKTVHGAGSFFGPSSDANLRMSQDSVGVSVGWNF
jgi:long-chain fatty acid transport protein